MEGTLSNQSHQENMVVLEEKWPIIISSSLQNSEIFTTLYEKHKVRVSGNIIDNSIIFPKSAVAFMILPIREISLERSRHVLNEKVIERVTQFSQLHRNCFILTISALMEEQELAILSSLQERFFTFPLTYYPAHNYKECITFMQHIAKVTSKPTSTLLKTRLGNLTASSISEEVVLNILSTVGLSCHDCFVLQQGCHTLSNIAGASVQELMDCSLDKKTAKKVFDFFQKNSLSF